MPESADIKQGEAAPTQSEALIVASIIARTSADFSGRAESTISEALVEQFTVAGLEISTAEAKRVAHDIALAPKTRKQQDD